MKQFTAERAMTASLARHELLVCVYYRVDAVDAARASGVVREFQRTLAQRHPALQAEVLLRFDLTPAAPPPDVPSDSAVVPVPAAEPRQATLMETYRLGLPDACGTDAASAATHEFLHALETAAAPAAGLLRGVRHVELFAPCAS